MNAGVNEEPFAKSLAHGKHVIEVQLSWQLP